MELRPVKVLLRKAGNVFTDGEMESRPAVYGKGYFHGWEDYKTEDYSCKYAIVELEDGSIRKFEPHDVQFTDTFDTSKLI